jgi:hypothetical protein
MITALRKKRAALAGEYDLAVARAEANARVLSKAGDYPLLGGGDVNWHGWTGHSSADALQRAAGAEKRRHAGRLHAGV